ncbi:FxsA family protein [Consotaella aegiceratis]|uniref:FxsA family protein n=1 Tax=Consotaella aegiceratis TaxID=3097961 RepID=UPI002F3FD607
MPLTLIPVLLLVVPILEIAVFIMVGNLIGLWPTLGLVLLTAVLGTMLLRRQGLGTLARIQAETRAGRLPGREMVHGVMIMAAGILLLTPGLVTDAIGFLLFVPQFRDLAWRWLKDRVVVVAASPGQGFWRGRGPATRPDRPDVVDLSGDEFHRQGDGSSPWQGQNDDGQGPRTLH